MKNVWQLSKEMQRVEEAIDRSAEANEGEISDDVEIALSELINDFREYADDLAWLIRKRTAEAEMFAMQAKKFADEASKLKRSVDALKQFALQGMEFVGEKKLGPLSVCKNGGKLPLVLTDEVPIEYKKVIYQEDNELIRQVLDSGDQLSFAKYGERGTHVRIQAT